MKLKFILPIIVSLIISLIILIVLYFLWSFKVSNYCQNNIEGFKEKSNTYLPATKEETQKFGITSITLSFREQLECEHDPKTLKRFNSIF